MPMLAFQCSNASSNCGDKSYHSLGCRLGNTHIPGLCMLFLVLVPSVLGQMCMHLRRDMHLRVLGVEDARYFLCKTFSSTLLKSS